MSTTAEGSRRQLHRFAWIVTNWLCKEVAIGLAGVSERAGAATTKTGPRSFLTLLRDQLEIINETLVSGLFKDIPEAEAELRKLLSALERLSTWPVKFRSPATGLAVVTETAYPRLHKISDNQQQDRILARTSIIKLAGSGKGGEKSRPALLESLRGFAPVETPPPGSEVSQLPNRSSGRSSEVDGATECLRELHNTLCLLARCPEITDVAAIKKPHFKANVSLNFGCKPNKSDDGASLDLFLSHSHLDDDGSQQYHWRQACIRASVQGSKIKFEQAGIQVWNLCNLLREPDQAKLKLSATREGLYREKLELPDHTISVRAASVSLAKILTLDKMRNDQQRRLLLSYLIAKAIWKFYDVDWMAEDWTKDTVHFMRHDLQFLGKNKWRCPPLSHKPFIATELRSSCTTAEQWKRNEMDSYSNRSHVLPKILALGIVLLEIELGRPILNAVDSQEFPAATPQQRANSAHITACNLLRSPEWETRSQRAYQPIATAIKACLTLDQDLERYIDLEKPRQSLYEAVVAPLDNLFTACWKRPDEFVMDPIEFEEPDVALFPDPDDHAPQSRGRDVLDLTDVDKALPSAVRLQPNLDDKLQDTVLAAGSTISGEEQALRSQADQWVTKFKRMNQDFGIDEESRTIRVAILDTGLDSLHSRFRKHPRVADYKSFTEDGYADRDPVGHGTHIAGIILDLAPNVDLYIAQIADSKSFDSHRQIVMALRWARQKWKVDMICMSFGYHKVVGEDLVKREIDNCLDNDGNKIAVFASASNDGANMPRTYPGSYDRVLCIHSATGLGAPSAFNPSALSRDLKKDNFCVLGDSVKSTWPSSPENRSTYRYMSGTSFATPVAVAIAAFAIGYIRVHLRDFGWNTDPQSPEGVRALFNLMAKDNKRDKYDMVFPTAFFNKFDQETIRMKLVLELGGYHRG